jgi:hypothetical protein
MIGTNRLAAIFFEVRLSDSPRTGAFLVDGAPELCRFLEA